MRILLVLDDDYARLLRAVAGIQPLQEKEEIRILAPSPVYGNKGKEILPDFLLVKKGEVGRGPSSWDKITQKIL